MFLLQIQYSSTTLNRRVDLRSPEGGVVTIFHDVHKSHNKDTIQEQIAACKEITTTNPLIHVENPLSAEQSNFSEQLNKLAKQNKMEFLQEFSKAIWQNEPNDKFIITDPRANFMLFNDASRCLELIRKTIKDKSLQDAFTKKLIEKYDNPELNLFNYFDELKAKIVTHIEKLDPKLFSVELKELIEYDALFTRILGQLQSLEASEKAEYSSKIFKNLHTEGFPMRDLALLQNISRLIVHLIEFDYCDFVLHNPNERIYIFTGGKHGVNLEVMLIKAGFKRIYETCPKNYYMQQGSIVSAISNNGQLFLDRVPPLTSEQILHDPERHGDYVEL